MSYIPMCNQCGAALARKYPATCDDVRLRDV
jgi:hypothetical protein